MPAVVTICPTCRAPLSDAALTVCPNCSRSLANAPTRVLHDLNSTTDFGIVSEQETEDGLIGSELGNYAIERFMGQGGMARVYRAKHLTLERPCAIKVLKQDFVERAAGAVAAFLAEARAAAALVHPHVVTIHSIGYERGHHFIEMEFIDGNSLASLLDTEGSFDSATATKFMVEICSALTLAHQFGMVHRDIKPANVLVTRERLAKLADFGLAKRVQEKHGDDGKFLTGTPNYMAPELFEGLPADKRSDVYAMGVTYYLLLTGRLPFAGDTLAEVMQRHLHHELPDIDKLGEVIPQNAARLIRRCLAKEPTERFADAEVLLHELRAVYGSLRSLESLLHESLRREKAVSLVGEDDHFQAIVQLSAGRKQKVTIEVRDSTAVAEQVVRISSICGKADEKHFLRALRLNPDFPYGALGVEIINGTPHFVMTNVFPRATCDPEEIRLSVLGIALHADDAERWLSERDVN
jgi:serine/threonine protein kinase